MLFSMGTEFGLSGKPGIVLLALLFGCGDSSPTRDAAIDADIEDTATDTDEPVDVAAPEDAPRDVPTEDAITTERRLPAMFRFDAYASYTAPDGRTAECILDWIFELEHETRRDQSVLEYEGHHGGGATRSVLKPDESGLAFHIDVYGDAIARWTLPHRFEIEIPINATAEGRFYTSLAHLEGTIDDNGHGEGTWRCDPLDIEDGGYLDNEVSADGTWTTTPIRDEPGDPCAVNNGDCDLMTTCTSDHGVAVCGPCPEGTVGSGVIGCFECHHDEDCAEGERCDNEGGNVCVAGS